MTFLNRVDEAHYQVGLFVTEESASLDKEVVEKVSRSALSKIGNTVADACLSLINRIVTWIKLAVDWIVKIFLSLFGCMKRVPVKEEHGSVEANLPSRDSSLPSARTLAPDFIHPPVHEIKSSFTVVNPLVALEPIGVDVDPARIEGGIIPYQSEKRLIIVPSLADQIRQSSHLTFQVGQSSKRLPNPFSSGRSLSIAQLNSFRKDIVDLIDLAAPHPHVHIKINQDLSIRIDNPSYGRRPNVQALLDHSANSLQAIMEAPTSMRKEKALQVIESIDSKNGQRLLAVRGCASHCSCSHCVQKGMVLNTPYYRIELEEGEQILIDNPFGRGVKPSDQDVYQFNQNVGRVMELLRGRTAVKIGLGESSAVVFKIPKDATMSPRLLTAGLLQIANSHKTSQTAQLLLSAPARTDSTLATRSITLSPDLKLPVVLYPIPESKGKVSVSSLSEQLTGSIQLLAAEQYVETSVVNTDLSRFPSIDSKRTDLLSGRNQLLNYLDGISTVWNQHPIILGQTIQYCVELSERNIPLSESQKDGIRTFFDKVKSVPELELQFFLTNRIALQRILSPRLDALLSIKKPSRNQLLETDLAKAELATSFGYGIVPTGAGKNGAVFIKTFEDRPVGVFKAPKTLGIFDLIERAKLFFGQARLLSSEPMAQEYAEIVAADLSRELGFENIAPEAVMAEFAGERGAFISFLDGYRELSKVKAIFDRRAEFDREEVIKWQMGVIWNALIHNLDPHDDNIFVKVNDSCKLEALTMIDHGNCFPVANPGWLGARGNLGAYGRFAISKIPFLKEVRTFIREKITEDALRAFFDANEDRIRFFQSPMRKLQLERVRILRMVADKVIKDPVELSRIQTDGDFSKYLDGQNAQSSNEELERSMTDLLQTLQIIRS
jgi:hypothetical protein